MSKGSDGAKKHMNRVLDKNGQCPSEEVSLRRKYSKEVAIAKVESYFCEHCKVQILDHESVMKHVGTHIEFCTGRASKFGRDDALWLRLEGEHCDPQGVPPGGVLNSGHTANPPEDNTENNYTWENLEQHFWGIFDDNIGMKHGGNSGASLTVDHENNAPSAAVYSSGSNGSNSGNTGAVANTA